ARDKGLAPWRQGMALAEQPTEGTIQSRILRDIQRVLKRYRDHLPIGPRAVVYQLLATWVPRHYADKEALRKEVDRVLGKADRALIIPSNAIDDQRTVWDGPFAVDGLPGLVGQMQIDRQAGQPGRIEVWIEARGNLSRIARICRPYGINVYSGS